MVQNPVAASRRCTMRFRRNTVVISGSHGVRVLGVILVEAGPAMQSIRLLNYWRNPR